MTLTKCKEKPPGQVAKPVNLPEETLPQLCWGRTTCGPRRKSCDDACMHDDGRSDSCMCREDHVCARTGKGREGEKTDAEWQCIEAAAVPADVVPEDIAASDDSCAFPIDDVKAAIAKLKEKKPRTIKCESQKCRVGPAHEFEGNLKPCPGRREGGGGGGGRMLGGGSFGAGGTAHVGGPTTKGGLDAGLVHRSSFSEDVKDSNNRSIALMLGRSP